MSMSPYFYFTRVEEIQRVFFSSAIPTLLFIIIIFSFEPYYSIFHLTLLYTFSFTFVVDIDIPLPFLYGEKQLIPWRSIDCDFIQALTSYFDSVNWHLVFFWDTGKLQERSSATSFKVRPTSTWVPPNAGAAVDPWTSKMQHLFIFYFMQIFFLYPCITYGIIPLHINISHSDFPYRFV